MKEPGVDHLGSYLAIIGRLGFNFKLSNDVTHFPGKFFFKMMKRSYPVIHGNGDTPLAAVQAAVKDLKKVEQEYMIPKRKEKQRETEQE